MLTGQAKKSSVLKGVTEEKKSVSDLQFRQINVDSKNEGKDIWDLKYWLNFDAICNRRRKGIETENEIINFAHFVFN